MKKIMMLCLVVTALVACNSSSSKEEKPETTAPITENPDYQDGLALVAKHKCLTCHAVDKTITGPPYREVAKKYADNPDTIISHLARKIIDGGKGVWGELLMTPHPDVSREEAEKMVKYILLLKK